MSRRYMMLSLWALGNLAACQATAELTGTLVASSASPDAGSGAVEGDSGSGGGTSDSGSGASDSGAGAGDSGSGASDSGSGDSGGGQTGDHWTCADAVRFDPGNPQITVPDLVIRCSDKTIGLADTSSPTAVVGDGTPASCTEAALRSAVEAGGVITFNCGSAPHTIAVESQLEVPREIDTIIDGNNLITLDGQHKTRILYMHSPNCHVGAHSLTVQRLTFTRGFSQPDGCKDEIPGSKCAYGYRSVGGGGAIWVRDIALRVYDVIFTNNHTPAPGPDIGGGAIYAFCTPDVKIDRSRFIHNSGSNAGAFGGLQAKVVIYNSMFRDNWTRGHGQNIYSASACSETFQHEHQVGAGGNGGAAAIDGVGQHPLEMCGVEFVNNEATELGGAFFRTPNTDTSVLTIDNSRFVGNTGHAGGGVFYSEHLTANISNSYFGENKADRLSSVMFFGDRMVEVNITNSTFYKNSSGQYSGVLHADGGYNGTVTNCTFAENSSPYAPVARESSLVFNSCIFQDNVNTDGGRICETDHSGSNNFQWPEGTACASGTRFVDTELAAPSIPSGSSVDVLIPADGSPARTAGAGAYHP